MRWALIGLLAIASPWAVADLLHPVLLGGSLPDSGDENVRGIVRIEAFNAEGKSELKCTGSLIAEDAVLTAASCVKDQTGYFEVSFENPDTRVITVRRVDRAGGFKKSDKSIEGYSPFAFAEGNLMLIFFKGGLPKGAKVFSTMGPAANASDLETARPYVVYGYGWNGAPESNELKFATAGLIRAVEPVVNLRLGAWLCTGDAGGPVLALQPNGEFILIGVVSGGTPLEVKRYDEFGAMCRVDVYAPLLNQEWRRLKGKKASWFDEMFRLGRKWLKTQKSVGSTKRDI